MESQGWKGGNSSGSPHRPGQQQPQQQHQQSASPSHGYEVQSTYFPTESGAASYQPPADDDPFRLRDSDNPFAGTLAGHSQVVAVPENSTVTIQSGAAAGNVVLQFNDSQLHHGNSPQGKMGGSEVPRVTAYSDGHNLLPGPGGQGGSPPAGGDGEPSDFNKKYSFLNVKAYRRHFNVDTSDVLGRIADSMVGFWKADFFEKTTDNADLYGPFWVATTLIFVTAVAGNYANYVSYLNKHSDVAAAGSVWYYDVNKVTYSAVLFYGYVGLIGLALYACLRWWFKSEVSLVQVWCLYGYSLSIFIPTSFLCILPYQVLRWVLVAVATLLSGLFLLTNFKAPIFDVAGAKATPIFLAVGLMHLGVGLAMMLFFFVYW